MSKVRYYKLASMPKPETGLKKQYYTKGNNGNNWGPEGTLFTTKQLLAVLNSKLKTEAFESIDDFPSNWIIEEYFISYNTTTDIKNFIKFKSSKPILKDN